MAEVTEKVGAASEHLALRSVKRFFVMRLKSTQHCKVSATTVVALISEMNFSLADYFSGSSLLSKYLQTLVGLLSLLSSCLWLDFIRSIHAHLGPRPHFCS